MGMFINGEFSRKDGIKEISYGIQEAVSTAIAIPFLHFCLEFTCVGKTSLIHVPVCVCGRGRWVDVGWM